MEKPHQPPVTDAEEFPPLQDDPTMPAPEEPAAAVATAESPAPVEPEVPTNPKEDPWAEENQPAPAPIIPPPPVGIPTAIVGIIIAIAVAAIVFLLIQNRNLQSRLDHAPKPDTAQAPDFLIVSAVYGSGEHFSDVTDRVIELLRTPNAEFNAKPAALHKDPVPGWNKELVIIYKTGDQRHIFKTGEGGKVTLATLLDEAKK